MYVSIIFNKNRTMNNIASIKSAYVSGGKVHDVTVRVQVSDGIGYHIIGLPDAAVRETLLRVITALQSTGGHVPGKKVVICVEPVEEIKANFSCFDLPIAVAILLATGQVSFKHDATIYGALALDGKLLAAGGELEVLEAVREAHGLFVSSIDGLRPVTSNRRLIGFESLRHLTSYAETCNLLAR